MDFSIESEYTIWIISNQNIYQLFRMVIGFFSVLKLMT